MMIHPYIKKLIAAAALAFGGVIMTGGLFIDPVQEDEILISNLDAFTLHPGCKTWIGNCDDPVPDANLISGELQ